jgi:hypothetical protein
VGTVATFQPKGSGCGQSLGYGFRVDIAGLDYFFDGKSIDLVWSSSPTGPLKVELGDFVVFQSSFPPAPYNFCADYNLNGRIDVGDHALLTTHFLHACSGSGVISTGLDEVPSSSPLQAEPTSWGRVKAGYR